MKVILEAQHAVGHVQPRGVGHYSISIIQALLRRKTFDYELTFFDKGREMGNRERAFKYFGEYGVPMRECNELDYRTASRDNGVWDIKNYNEWTGTDGDVYHFMNPISIPSKLKGKAVVTVHDMNDESHSEHTLSLFKTGFERIKAIKPFIITDSESSRSQVLQYTSVPAERIAVVYLSYDEDNLFPDPEPSPAAGGRYFLYLGAFAANKNIERIVEAFNITAEKHKDIKLVLAGKPFWHKTDVIYQKIAVSPFRERITTPGYVDAETKRRLMSNAVCFLFPSLCEGFGLPVLEAMACGCPVITADNTSLPEVGGDAAVYVDAYSTEQLAFEMDRVASSVSFCEELRQKGFAQCKKFSWDKTAAETEEVYKIAAAS